MSPIATKQRHQFNVSLTQYISAYFYSYTSFLLRIICNNNIQTHSPQKLMTKMLEIKKQINKMFQKVNIELHPLMVSFLTALEPSHEQTMLLPLIAPANHNKVNESKTLQIIHTLMGNFCHGDKNKESQPEDMGNDSSIMLANHAKVSYNFLQKNIQNWNNAYHYLT